MSGKQDPVVPYDASDPSADKWTTYKDYLKRKRDYKREWRKRKNPSTDPEKRSFVQPSGPDPYSYRHVIKRKVYNADQSQLEEAVNHIQYIHRESPEQQHEEEIANHSHLIAMVCQEDDEEANEEVHLDHFNEVSEGYQEAVQEEKETVKEDLPSEDILTHDDIEFTDRWNTVYNRLISLQDTGKRLRYLKIIEDIVGELW